MSDTFNIGVMAFAFMMGKDNTGPRIMAFAGVRGRLLLGEHFRIGCNIWQFLWRRRTIRPPANPSAEVRDLKKLDCD